MWELTACSLWFEKNSSNIFYNKGYRNILKDGDLFITKNLLSKYNIYELIDLRTMYL